MTNHNKKEDCFYIYKWNLLIATSYLATLKLKLELDEDEDEEKVGEGVAIVNIIDFLSYYDDFSIKLKNYCLCLIPYLQKWP